jgi:hypothetical protein
MNAVVYAPIIAPGRETKAKIEPDLYSILFILAYDKEPENELKKTTAKDMPTSESGLMFGYKNSRTGININPPPAPINVPIVPTANPKGMRMKGFSIKSKPPVELKAKRVILLH